MAYFNTDTYKMKREILNFARNFSGGLSTPDAKFFADMTYGIAEILKYARVEIRDWFKPKRTD